MIEKRCPRCNKEKPLDDFNKNRSAKDGLDRWCKLCARENVRMWRINNREKCNESQRLWLSKNKDKHKIYNQKWLSKNRNKYNEYNRKWSSDNRDKCMEYTRNWKARNVDRCRLNARKRNLIPKNRLNMRIRTRLIASIKGNKKGRHWETLVGYKLENLVGCIENKFKIGMSWRNMGEWHLDHIIPISLWEFEKPEDREFKQCWSLANLQPLWATENFKKGNRI